MNTMRNIKILHASAIAVGAAIAVSVPAILFASTGTAPAANPTVFTNPDGTLEVIYSGGGLSSFASIVDAINPVGVTEICHYHSEGTMATPPFPYDIDVLVTGPTPSPPVTILVPQLGGSYTVNVSCRGTGNSAGYSPVYY
jgi:hypothetical protein